MSSLVLLSDYHNYFLYGGHANMRKSFDGLSGIVLNELGRQVNDKDVFIFLNKQRTHINGLLYEQMALHYFTAGCIRAGLHWLMTLLQIAASV